MRKQISSRVSLWVFSSMLASTVALMLLIAVSPLLAQLPTGTILGVVKDTSGGTVPDATITVTSIETGAVRTTNTGSDGEYRVPALQPGHYDVKAEKNGFKTMTQTGLTLDVAAEIVVNVALEVGSSTQEVTVTAEASQVNTTTSSLGGLVNDEKMADLPLNGRNFVDLALMQAGVTNDTNTSIGGGGTDGTAFSSNGAPIRANNFTIDGAPMINVKGNTASAVGTTLGVDGIKEYRVITNAFGAEYGLSMGSQVVIVSKGGSNEFHGDVFEYLRNNHMDARNFFDYSYLTTGNRLPLLQRNNFGGSFGGPIKKEKTFFYAVYEGLRQNQGQSLIFNVFASNCHVVTANPCATTTANPAGNVAPGVQPLLALYPNPNVPGTNEYSVAPVYPTNVDFGQIRVDHNFSTADSFFGRYTIQSSSNTSATTFPETAYKNVGTGLLGRDQFTTLSENHIFSPTLLNTARFSYSRTSILLNASIPSALSQPPYSFVAGQAMGTFSIGSLTGLGASGSAPSAYQQNIYTLSDDLYYTKGRHALKFGVLFNRIEYYTLATNSIRGTVPFANQASFLAGVYTNGVSVLTPGSNTLRMPRFYTYGFYAQDDWRVTQRLTLNLGLRYEPDSTAFDRNGDNYAFHNFPTATTTTYGAPFANPSRKNFGPRVGLAWDVTGKGKTSIRAAFGEYYDVNSEGFQFYVTSLGTPPLSSLLNPPANTAANPVTFPLNLATTPANSVKTQEYQINQPHLLQWNVTVEQQLAPSLSLSLSYVGTRGIHLWDDEEGNPCIPTSITNNIPFWAKDCGQGRLNPLWGDFVEAATNADSNYNGLQAVVTKRVSHGLEVQGAYTWAKVMDDGQGSFLTSECQTGGANPQMSSEPQRKLFDYGPACFDVKDNLRVNVLYHIPNTKLDNTFARSVVNGWWVGSIISWETGLSFTPYDNNYRSFSDNLNSIPSGNNTTRVTINTATVAPGQTGPDGTTNSTSSTFVPYNGSTVITGNPRQWFNPLMFTPGPIGFLGNTSKDFLRGPHLSNVDFSLNKDTSVPRLGEDAKVEFRAEFFNIFNHANFGMPSPIAYAGNLTDLGQYTEAPLSNAGQITTTVTTSRQIQLSLKLIF